MRFSDGEPVTEMFKRFFDCSLYLFGGCVFLLGVYAAVIHGPEWLSRF